MKNIKLIEYFEENYKNVLDTRTYFEVFKLLNKNNNIIDIIFKYHLFELLYFFEIKEVDLFFKKISKNNNITELICLKGFQYELLFNFLNNLNFNFDKKEILKNLKSNNINNSILKTLEEKKDVEFFNIKDLEKFERKELNKDKLNELE